MAHENALADIESGAKLEPADTPFVQGEEQEVAAASIEPSATPQVGASVSTRATPASAQAKALFTPSENGGSGVKPETVKAGSRTRAAADMAPPEEAPKRRRVSSDSVEPNAAIPAQ